MWDSCAALNRYNNWGPIRNTEAVIRLTNKRVILSAYQFSVEMSPPNHVVTALSVDGFPQPTSVLLKGNNAFLDLHGAWARYYYRGVHYLIFNIVLLLVWPLLTVKNSIKTTRTYMPWWCLHLVELSVLILKQLSLSAIPTHGPQLMSPLPLHYPNKVMLLSCISFLALLVQMTLPCVSVLTQSLNNTLYLWLANMLVTLDCGKGLSRLDNTKFHWIIGQQELLFIQYLVIQNGGDGTRWWTGLWP